MYNKWTFVVKIVEISLIVCPLPLRFCVILAFVWEVNNSPENLMCKYECGNFCENDEEYVKDFEKQKTKLPPKICIELEN